jgi:geranylgeranylglycerol-phosphate geranylgeranyltransferase
LKEKLAAVFKITRPINFLITFISVIVAAIICLPQNYSELIILIVATAAALTTAAGNIINDIFDIEIDKINRPQRPLPLKKISIKEAYILYSLFTVISLLLSLWLNLSALLIVLFSHLLLFLYSKYLKQIPFVGNITVAFMTGLVFILGGVVVGNSSAAIVPAIFAFLINLIREIVKDMQDIEGDRQAGLLTFPIKFGVLKSKFLISFFIFILITFTLYPFITQLYKIEFFVVVMVLVNPIMIYIIKKIYEKDSLKSLKKISIILKLSMILGLIAIYLGA